MKLRSGKVLKHRNSPKTPPSSPRSASFQSPKPSSPKTRSHSAKTQKKPKIIITPQDEEETQLSSVSQHRMTLRSSKSKTHL